MNFFWVFLGGGIGSVLRYSISLGYVNTFSQKWSALAATLTSNILACIFLAFLWYFQQNSGMSKSAYLLLGTGLCGGFSTFSTFSLETFYFWRNGDWAFAVGNVVVSVALGLIAIAAIVKALPNAEV